MNKNVAADSSVLFGEWLLFFEGNFARNGLEVVVKDVERAWKV